VVGGLECGVLYIIDVDWSVEKEGRHCLLAGLKGHSGKFAGMRTRCFGARSKSPLRT
jgi:hypothetical protein